MPEKVALAVDDLLYTQQEIAEKLGVSQPMVHHHYRRYYEGLQDKPQTDPELHDQLTQEQV